MAPVNAVGNAAWKWSCHRPHHVFGRIDDWERVERRRRLGEAWVVANNSRTVVAVVDAVVSDVGDVVA